MAQTEPKLSLTLRPPPRRASVDAVPPPALLALARLLGRQAAREALAAPQSEESQPDEP